MRSTTIKNTTKTSSKIQRNKRLGRDAWITAARDALVTGGIESVKIERLAKALGAQRGSFYHHFKKRDDLLDELLEHWDRHNTHAYEQTIDSTTHNGVAELANIATMWLEEKSFDAAYDLAVRDWARASDTVARVVKRADKKRIRVLETIFHDLGYRGDNALVRARIAYYHQIGHLTVGLEINSKRRKELAPVFLDVLLGS